VELLGLFGVTMGMLLLPKLLALGLVLATADRGRGFGGAAALVRSAGAEVLFAALLAPVLMVQQSRAVIGTLLGYQVTWGTQQRGQAAQDGRMVARRYLPFTLLGLGWAGLAWWLTPGLLVWLIPVLAGLVLSIPIALLSGRADLGLRARRAGWFLTPEEVAPPAALAPLLRLTDSVPEAPAPIGPLARKAA
jgi:membrane glycosyltransferase